jgi:tetratricopeptide (TPR) repeat protein
MKIFLSAVSSQFKACRDALASDLRAVGAEVVVQEDFQQHGRTLLEKLEQYIASCDRVIALVGDAYGWEPDEAARPAGFPRRSYSQWEYYFTEGERLDGSRQPVKEVYLYFASPEFVAAHAVQQSGDAAALQQAFLAELHGSGKDWNPFSSLDQLRALVLRDGFRLQQRGPQPRNLPYASLGSLFKGREQVLADIAQHFERAPHQPLVIHGLGGMGKSRLAIEYACRHQQEHTALLTVTADKPESLQQNLAALCAEDVLNLPEREAKEQAVQAAAVLRWLDQNPGWLLILDNVDDRPAAAAVGELLPQLQGGHVLITARFTEWGGDVALHELHELEAPAAVAFLLERTDGRRTAAASDAEDAHTLAETLGRLALALEQAAAFICHQRITLGDYLGRWRKREAKVRQWHDARLMHYPRSLLVTWDTSFDQLDTPAQALLTLLAWLSPAPIPRALLEGEKAAQILAECVARLQPSVQATDPVTADMEDALALLASFSLLQWESGNQSFRVHRLVQEVTRERLAPDHRRPWLEAILALMDDYLPADPPPQDVRSWPLWEPIQPHVMAMVDVADEAGIAEPTSRLMNELGVLLEKKSLWEAAEPLMRRALALHEQRHGPAHPDVAVHLNNLGQLLQATNRLAEAERLMRRALVIDGQSYSTAHPNVAIHLNNLALLLQDTNRLAEAEQLMRQALAIHEQCHGPDHPDVAVHLNNLALLLQDTNRLAEAEGLMRQALAIDEQHYSSAHPAVAVDLNNLAQLLKATNRLAEAEPLMRRALSIDEQNYGPHHPRVAVDLNNLAQLLKATDRLAEAEPLMRRTLAIDERSYGPDHPDVAIDLNNLAMLLCDTNRLAEAEPLVHRALAIDERSYGPDHPRVATDLSTLAVLLQDTNRLAKAEQPMRRALAIDEQSYGPDHPRVASDLNNLAQLLQATNRLAEAEPMMRRHLEIFLRFTATTAHEHPHLRAAVGNYVGLLEAMGRSQEEIRVQMNQVMEPFGLQWDE